MGYSLDFRHLHTFNEKLQWMKLYDRNPIYTKLADKYKVREYVGELIGTKYLKKVIGVYNSVNDIDWKSIPENFVIKATHGSGWNIFCENKENFDLDKSKGIIINWLSTNFYRRFREWQYKEIDPKIMVETLIRGEPGYSLDEYQFYCFDGSVEFVQVDKKCNLSDHSRFFVDIMWETMPFVFLRYPIIQKPSSPPRQFRDMIRLAEKVSGSIPFCRVDFLFSGSEIYFNEITLTPGGGYIKISPVSNDLKIGSLFRCKQ